MVKVLNHLTLALGFNGDSANDMAISGEKLSFNTFAAGSFVKGFPDMIKEYSLDQVFK